MQRILVAILSFTLLAVYVPSESEAAGERAAEIYVDDIEVSDGDVSYVADGVTYVPIRPVCEALGASVYWDNQSKTVTVLAPGLQLNARAGDRYLEANGRYFYIEKGCHFADGRFMVPARVLAEAFGAEIAWKNSVGGVVVSGGGMPVAAGDEFYDSEDIYWLSRIIYAEAGGESLEGKIAVGNVVLNRVEDASFPDTVEDVIFDKRSGIQFSPAYSGAIYNTPTQECIIAAKLALEGVDIVGECLYFTSAWAASSSWAGRNREFYARIDDQVFFM